ncbi:hypothetical protein BC938DRAFT_478515 [Jimgerdemannia flammicorona]|uniref:Arb2 domain-containing protein n=1 Tax=Jimgerdemannia flammicorona TaxID=994334 RepID=A0A433QMR4_9FUNG|nr:hypothetical protein BC938DRAFT_478515 [Jimgerdemannia flammicorona]
MMGNIVGRYKRNNKELPEFPKNIADFGYAFNEQGELRNIETNGRFEFNVVDDDRKFNQAHYEALGDAIGIWIESELETRFGLVKRVIPEEGDRHDTDDHRGESGPTATSRIYMRYAECASWLDGTFYVRVYSIIPSLPNPPPLPLLSQYPIPLPPFSKAPMPSQTPPRSCFSSKVPVPFVRASGRVLSSSTTRSRQPTSPISHPHAARQHVPLHPSREGAGLVRDCIQPKRERRRAANHARERRAVRLRHYDGGFAQEANFTERVRAIALTDSVHSAGSVYDTQGMIKQWFSDNAINWIKSNKPLGAHEPSAERYFGCPCVSAGLTRLIHFLAVLAGTHTNQATPSTSTPPERRLRPCSISSILGW